MERTGIRDYSDPAGSAALAPVRRRCINCRRLLYEQAEEYPAVRIKPWLCGKCRSV